jgi:hypothetical protein
MEEKAVMKCKSIAMPSKEFESKKKKVKKEMALLEEEEEDYFM